jgi:CheY-like chemotaxis protein
MTSRSAVILLVEDDPDDVFFLRHAFRKAGVRQAVRVVPDGREAIDYLGGAGPYGDRARHPLPCLVLLDIKLPKESGLDVLRWLRGRTEHKDLPVVMLTSSDLPADRAEASRHRIEAYQVKPMRMDDLVRMAHGIRQLAEAHCKSAQPCPEEGKAEE